MANPTRPRERAANLWAQAKVSTATFLVILTGAVLTALLAMVLEDLLPVDKPRVYSALRIGLLIATMLLLGMALWYRNRVYQRTGTVFYARVLDEIMSDWHASASIDAKSRRMSLRTVTNWIDTQHLTPGGTIDTVEATNSTAATLTLLINTDRDDTGSILAPNMLWPVAMTVGYRLFDIPDLRLLELGAGAPNTNGARNEIEWAVPPAMDPAALDLEINRELHLDRKTVTNPIPGADRVGLLLAFGKAAEQVNTTKAFAAFGASEYTIVAFQDPALRPGNLTHGALNADHFTKLARMLPEVIAKAKQRAGQRELVIAAAMPKSVAVALGMELARRNVRFFAGTYLLHWDRDAAQFHPMRTHPSQPAVSPRTPPSP